MADIAFQQSLVAVSEACQAARLADLAVQVWTSDGASAHGVPDILQTPASSDDLTQDALIIDNTVIRLGKLQRFAILAPDQDTSPTSRRPTHEPT